MFDVVLIGSGGTEGLFLKRLETLNEPLVILSTSKNNSLPAALEIKTYLENHNKLCFLLSGEEKHIASMLKHIATIISAYRKQLDNLYLPDTLDVDTDSDVLETMLKRDGLSGSDFEQAEQEGTPGTMN